MALERISDDVIGLDGSVPESQQAGGVGCKHLKFATKIFTKYLLDIYKN